MKIKAINFFWKSLKILALLAIAGSLLIGWNLYRGGVNLSLVATIAGKILTPNNTDLNVSIGKAALTWHKGAFPIGIKVYDFHLTNQKDEVVSAIPAMKFSLSLTALFHGDLAPASMDFYEPVMHIYLAKSGEIGMGFNNESKTESSYIPLTEAKSDNASLYRLPYDYLRSLRIKNGKLVIHDEVNGKSWFFPVIDVYLYKKDYLIEMTGLINLDQVEKTRSPINVVAVFDTKTSLLHLDTRIKDFYLPAPAKEFLGNIAIDVPLKVDLSTSIDLNANSAYRNFRERFIKNTFHITFANAEVVVPEPFSVRYDLKEMQIEGFADEGLAETHITKIYLKAKNGAFVSGTGMIMGLGQAIDTSSLNDLKMSYSLTGNDIKIKDLKHYWPANAGPSTYVWFKNNVNKGKVSKADFKLSFAGTPDKGIELSEVDGKAFVENTTVSYLDGLPVVKDVSGNIKLTKDDVRIIINKGHSLGLNLYEADLYFYDIWEPVEKSEITVKVKGDLHDALSLLDSDSLNLLQETSFSSQDTKGFCDATVKFAFPLRKDLTLKLVKTDGEADILKAYLPFTGTPYALADAGLKLKIDNSLLTVTGEGNVNGILVSSIVWKEKFTGEKAGSELSFAILMDNEARKTFNLSDFYLLNQDNISGPFLVQADVSLNRKKDGMFKLAADFTDTKFHNKDLSIFKDYKLASRGRVKGKIHNGAISKVEAFSLTAANGIDIKGSAVLKENHDLFNLTISHFLAGRNNFTAQINNISPDKTDILVKASSLDIAPFVNQLKSNTSGLQEPLAKRITFKGDMSTLWLSRNGFLNEAYLNFSYSKQGLENAAFTAKSAAGALYRMYFKPDKEKKVHHLSAWGDNAGALIEALGYTRNVKDGKLHIDAESSEQGELSGTLKIKDFKLIKANLMAKILSIASLTGIGEVLQGEGLVFDMAVVPFTYKNGALTIKDARTSGVSLGMTLEGTIKNGNLKLGGSIIPAYIVNSLLGRIPIIGALFSGGEEGGGLFAFRYDISGTVSKPKVSVNPLSALAPGFTRKVFDTDEDFDNNDAKEVEKE